jgi:hypothetical protein
MRILPEKNQRKTFDILIQSSLESIVNEGEVSPGFTRVFFKEFEGTLSFI